MPLGYGHESADARNRRREEEAAWKRKLEMDRAAADRAARAPWCRYVAARRWLIRHVVAAVEGAFGAAGGARSWRDSKSRVETAKRTADGLRQIADDGSLPIDARRRACVALGGLALLDADLVTHLYSSRQTPAERARYAAYARIRPDVFPELTTIADRRGFEAVAWFIRDIVDGQPFADPNAEFIEALRAAAGGAPSATVDPFVAEVLLGYESSLETAVGSPRDDGGRVEVEWLGGGRRVSETMSRGQFDELRILAKAGIYRWVIDPAVGDDEREADRLRKRAARLADLVRGHGIEVEYDGSRRTMTLLSALRVGTIQGALDRAKEADRIARETERQRYLDPG